MADQKLIWNQDNIKDVAESVGIANLSEEAIRSLTQDTEYRIGQVVVEAIRFMQAGKRTVLGTQDISQALKVLDVEPLYGYESTRPLRFGEASLGPGQPLYYLEDEEVDFEKLINAPLPKVPRDISFTAHWLAVEGVQPSIPQNPSTTDTRPDSLIAKGTSASPALTAITGTSDTGFRPQVKHILSKELILYFDKIKSAILDPSQDDDVLRLRAAALESMETDESLQQLVPYFAQFVAEKVTHGGGNLYVLGTMMELTNALTRNPTLFVDPYTTTLSSSVITCLIGRRPATLNNDDIIKSYALRDYSASLIGHIAEKYQKSSQQLKPRLARTFLKFFLDPKKPLDQHYGAVKGIVAIGGAEAVRMLIVPNLKAYNRVLAKGMAESPQDAERMVAALVKAVQGIVGPVVGLGMSAVDDQKLRERVEEFVGAIVAHQVERLGDGRVLKAIMECKSD